MIDIKQEIKVLKDEVNKLNMQIRDYKAANWFLGEVIKACNTTESFESLMEFLTDLMIGVMGLSSCSIWILEDRQNYTYATYYRTIDENNKFRFTRNAQIPKYLLNLEKSHIHNSGVSLYTFNMSKQSNSMMLSPLIDYSKNKKLGMIITEHQSNDFFSSSKAEFIELLTIQISTVIKGSKVYDRINEVTNKDALTNCYNRRYFEKLELNQNLKHIDYTLAVFDLDNFKSVNDVFGHEVGDEVLVDVANQALAIFRNRGGEVIRYGGDEFIVILHKNLEEALVILEEFRISVPKIAIIEKIGGFVTASIGVASYQETTSQMSNIFSIADKALLKCKETGKNKIEIGYEEL